MIFSLPVESRQYLRLSRLLEFRFSSEGSKLSIFWRNIVPPLSGRIQISTEISEMGCSETFDMRPTLFRNHIWYVYARIYFRFKLRMCALWLFCIHLKAERQQENYYQGRKIVAQLVICVFFRGSEYLNPNTSDLL